MNQPPIQLLREGFGAVEEPAFCAYCELNAVFRLMGTFTLQPEYLYGVPGEVKKDVVLQQIKRCTYCDASTVVHFHMDLFDPEDEWEEQVVKRADVVLPAPKPRELASEVPAKIRGLYEEAARCEVYGAPRAAAVMYRASVEEMCTHLGVANGKLYHRIEALAEQGLDVGMVRDMHEARMLGNDSIHDGLEYSPDEIADIAELIDEAFFLLFVQPAQREAFRQRRQSRREGAQAAI